jgi:hypothetical protein
MVSSGHYAQPVVTTIENGHINGASTVIEADGVRSIPVSQDVAQMAADHPYATAVLLEAAANVGEIAGAGINGAAINAAINVVLASIHQLGPVMRGEQELEWARLKPILEDAIAGLQSGFIRGAAVKLLQRLMGGNPLAALGFTLAAEAIPTLIPLIQGDITLEQALQQIGPRLLTSGIITTMVLLFPPVGLALVAASVLQAAWTELAPEWKAAFEVMAKQIAQATTASVNAAARELKRHPLNWLGSSAASAQASSAELAQMDALLDALLE